VPGGGDGGAVGRAGAGAGQAADMSDIYRKILLYQDIGPFLAYCWCIDIVGVRYLLEISLVLVMWLDFKDNASVGVGVVVGFWILLL
jgi:hypothetical protein